MKQLLGKYPSTTIIGAVIAGLMVVQEMTKAGETSWLNIAIAVAIAVLGRFSAGSSAEKPNK